MSQDKRQSKKERSFFDKAINFLCYAIVIYFVIGEFSHLYRSLNTIKAAPQLYERHYTASSTFPFVGSYFLMLPKDYDPQYKYPLVVDLHGISVNAYAAAELARPDMRSVYPFFVMVPIAPKRAFWSSPQDKDYQMMRNIPYPDHMPHVLKGVKAVQKEYNIDARRIILTGHSMGGSGVIGALQKYPSVFAVGVASAPSWSPEEIGNISAPLMIFHGTHDQQVPAVFSQQIKQAAKIQRKPIAVHFLSGQGHRIAPQVYGNTKLWDQLLRITEKQ